MLTLLKESCFNTVKQTEADLVLTVGGDCLLSDPSLADVTKCAAHTPQYCVVNMVH